MAEAMDCDLVYGLIPKQKVTAAAVPEPRSRRDEVKIGEKSFPILNSTTTLTDLLGLMQKIR
jgi:hypothetical protein